MHDAAYLRQVWLARRSCVSGCRPDRLSRLYLIRLKNQLASNQCARSSRWLHRSTGACVLLLIAIVILVLVVTWE